MAPAPVLLSAAMIVRNEERVLEGCLRSLQDVVDEVVVVDTGSADRSRQIALDLGARLHDVRWTDDFAAARNAALDLARGRWILYVDADERVRPGRAAAVRGQLEAPAVVGYQVRLHPRPRHTGYWELRLFLNDPLIRFRGVIHETIWPGLHAYRASRGGSVARSELVLDHVGYEGDQHAKHRRNLPLLLQALRADPTQVYHWCHLADIYAALGKDDQAERAWRRALRVTRRRPRPQPEDSLAYVGLLQWRLRRGRDVAALLAEARGRFPGHLQLAWLQGRWLMQAGRYAEAIPVFEALLAGAAAAEAEGAVAYDLRLLDVLPYDSLATCHFRLGHYAESRRYFELAAAREPDRLEYRAKAALCESLSRRGGAPPAPVA